MSRKSPERKRIGARVESTAQRHAARSVVMATIGAAIALGVAGAILIATRIGNDAAPSITSAPESGASLPSANVGKPPGMKRERAEPSPDGNDAARVVTSRQRQEETHCQQALDPRKDGWDSEALAEMTQGLVRELLQQGTARPGTREHARLLQVLAGTVRCGQLRPGDLYEAFRDSGIVVRRPKSTLPIDGGESHVGTDHVLAEIGQLLELFPDGAQRQTQVKTVRVELSDEKVTTFHVIEIQSGHAPQVAEQHSQWLCQWDMETPAAPRLTAIELHDYEEAQLVSSIGPTGKKWFTDCTAAAMADLPAFKEQLSYGLNHWLARIELTRGMYLFATSGLAIGDVNGDGREDVYVCQPGGLPNRLLIQNEDGTVTDRSAWSGTDWLDHTSSALLIDLDNDADQDLVLAAADRRILVMANDGQGRFELVSQLSIADHDVKSMCAADYDQDADLDVYITTAFAASQVRPGEPEARFTYHDANDGGANVLFRNDSGSAGWKFTDVTHEVGLDVHNRRHSLAAAWEDFDNDADQDLYVANDYGQNCLYRNDGGTFVDVAADLGVIDFGSSMSVSWADYDRDGYMDLYVGNMFSSAGNRITRQPNFRPADDQQTRDILARFAKGNSLFNNRGPGAAFVETSREARVELGRWAWSSLFADVNNDGWSDLFVANGYITTEDSGDL